MRLILSEDELLDLINSKPSFMEGRRVTSIKPVSCEDCSIDSEQLDPTIEPTGKDEDHGR
jgi:hypothetical protein